MGKNNPVAVRASRFSESSPETRVVCEALKAYSQHRKGPAWQLYSGQALRVLNALDERGFLAPKVNT